MFPGCFTMDMDDYMTLVLKEIIKGPSKEFFKYELLKRNIYQTQIWFSEISYYLFKVKISCFVQWGEFLI